MCFDVGNDESITPIIANVKREVIPDIHKSRVKINGLGGETDGLPVGGQMHDGDCTQK